jgi:hypothetical protein
MECFVALDLQGVTVLINEIKQSAQNFLSQIKGLIRMMPILYMVILISAAEVHMTQALAGENPVKTQLAQSSYKITEGEIEVCSAAYADSFKQTRGFAAPAGLPRSYCECALSMMNSGDGTREDIEGSKAFCRRTVYPKFGL